MGIKFGSLTAIKPDGWIGRKIAWMCKCECGKGTIVTRSNLVTGHTKSCGCLKRRSASQTITKYNSSTPYYRKPNWKGMNAGYVAKHAWITRRNGKPKQCLRCGVRCDPNHPKKIQWANISGNYLRRSSDYMALCASCHKKLDYRRRYGNKCRRGHTFSKSNTRLANYSNAGIKRYCRKCAAIRASQQRANS